MFISIRWLLEDWLDRFKDTGIKIARSATKITPPTIKPFVEKSLDILLSSFLESSLLSLSFDSITV